MKLLVCSYPQPVQGHRSWGGRRLPWRPPTRRRRARARDPAAVRAPTASTTTANATAAAASRGGSSSSIRQPTLGTLQPRPRSKPRTMPTRYQCSTSLCASCSLQQQLLLILRPAVQLGVGFIWNSGGGKTEVVYFSSSYESNLCFDHGLWWFLFR